MMWEDSSTESGGMLLVHWMHVYVKVNLIMLI